MKRGRRVWEEDLSAARLVPMRIVAARLGCCERTAWAAWRSGFDKLLMAPQARAVVADLIHVGEVAYQAVLDSKHDYTVRCTRPVKTESSALLLASSAECQPWVRELYGFSEEGCRDIRSANDK